MKKIIILAVFFFAVKSTDAQLAKPIPVKLTVTGTITKVNFHKPRTNCETGFGLCIQGTLNFTLTANQKLIPPTYVKGDAVTVYGIKTATTFELHVPSAIREALGNELLDYSKFILDEGNSISYAVDGGKTTTARLKSGTYPVKQIYNDYVIVVNIE